MSTEEEQLELGESVSETPKPRKKAKKKAAKKKAAKKAAKKSAAKKTAKPAKESAPEEAVAAPAPPPPADDDEVTFGAGIVVEDDAPPPPKAKRAARAPEAETPPAESASAEAEPAAAAAEQQRGHTESRSNEGNRHNHQNRQKSGPHNPNDPNRNKNFKKNKRGRNNKQNGKNKRWQNNKHKRSRDEESPLDFGELLEWEVFEELESIRTLASELSDDAKETLDYNRIYDMGLTELRGEAAALEIEMEQHAPNRNQLINAIAQQAGAAKTTILSTGVLELLEDDEGGMLVYERDNYRVKALSAFVPQVFIDHYGLKRGHIVQVQLHPHRENETCPFAVSILKVMDRDPDTLSEIVPFTEKGALLPDFAYSDGSKHRRQVGQSLHARRGLFDSCWLWPARPHRGTAPHG